MKCCLNKRSIFKYTVCDNFFSMNNTVEFSFGKIVLSKGSNINSNPEAKVIYVLFGKVKHDTNFLILNQNKNMVQKPVGVTNKFIVNKKYCAKAIW